MKKRKLIGVLISNPESVYSTRIMEGIIAQCELYDYDMAVICPLVDASHYDKGYLEGELNILELANFDLFDAVVLDSISFTNAGDISVCSPVVDILKSRCHKPVVTLDLKVEGYDYVSTDDSTAFSIITSHVIDVHKCTDLMFLTGSEGSEISEKRLKGFTDELERRGMPVDRDKIFYGDFWYTSGSALAEKIISGEVHRPQAVICGSDHMALGLVNRLTAEGINVPQDIIVTGYDATREALVNDISVTSFLPNIFRMSQQAINKIRERIEPDMPVSAPKEFSTDSLFTGASCGCDEDDLYLKQHLRESIYKTNRDYTNGDIPDNKDIGRLMESYMHEDLTASETPDECLYNVYLHTYLFRPYDHFYMCLNPNWLNTEKNISKGYPQNMSCVIHSVPEESPEHETADLHYSNDRNRAFKTKLMLPQMFEPREKPCVFYFMPMHFREVALGYSVLQCELEKKVHISCVIRNWMRNVNNALEMTRIHNKLRNFSLADNMTGLYNRRGMDVKIAQMMENADENDNIFVLVVDMDGLKIINDTYGHSEGDFGITTLSSTAKAITRVNEIAVRAGGDEFYIVGTGAFTEQDMEERVKTFYRILKSKNRISGKPYEVCASVGYHIKKLADINKIDEVIKIADANMYKNKCERRKQRI